MQSLSRAIKRGNAVLYFNEVTKSIEAVWKRGSTSSRWNHAEKNHCEDEETKYLQRVTKPLTKAFIDKQPQKKRDIYLS